MSRKKRKRCSKNLQRRSRSESKEEEKRPRVSNKKKQFRGGGVAETRA